MKQTKYQLRKQLRPTIAPLTAAVSLGLAGSHLQAATITVDTLADDLNGNNGCSLRQAIYTSQTVLTYGSCTPGDGNDTIVFAPGLSGTIELSADQSALGDSTILLAGPMTIEGPGADVITVQGAGDGPVVHVREFGSLPNPPNNVVISGLTITGGVTSGHGGGILNNHAILSLDEVVISGNQAGSGGGGIWHEIPNFSLFRSLTISNSVISGNLAVAGFGGGIGMALLQNRANASIQNSIVSGNTALNGPGGGLAVYSTDGHFYGGQVTLVNNQFVDNTGRYAGGGVYLRRAMIDDVIRDNLFLGNQATGAGDGGGLFVTEPLGGYVYNFGGSEMLISGNRFEDNLATGDGGGAWLAFERNSNNYTPFRNLNLEGNQWISNEAYDEGGGLVLRGYGLDALNLLYDEFHDNLSRGRGGGAYIYSEGTDLVAMHGLTLTGNQIPIPESFPATPNGGGLAITMQDGILFGNELMVSDNTSFGFGGGAHFAFADDAALYLFNSSFADNSTSIVGGGLSVFGRPAFSVIFNSRFIDNAMGSGSIGGGIAFTINFGDSAVHQVASSEISGNQASAGGGIHFRNNSGSSTLRLSNSTVSGNIAPAHGGGLSLAQEGGELELQARYSTIAFNQSSQAGGIRFEQAGCQLLNSIVANNSAATGPDLTGENNCQLMYSLISNPADAQLSIGPGSLVNVDPALGPLADNGGASRTHRIDSDSPAYNAGQRQYGYILPFDQRGQGFDRIMFDQIDMGAYEWRDRSDAIFQSRFEAD